MTEEEARQENVQQPQQPNEDSESPQTLKKRVGQFLARGLSFKSSKEKKTMTNEATEPEGTQQQSLSNHLLTDPEALTAEPKTPVNQAIDQFNGIKQALIGAEPEWVLPAVNKKASASEP